MLHRSGKPADPRPPGLECDKAAGERIASFSSQGNNGSPHRIPGARGKPEVHHTDCRARPRENKLSEISILGQDDPTIGVCARDDLVVFGSGGGFRHAQHVVTGIAERPHYRKIAAFVGHEAHQPD
jgi:hypothetical protein